MRLFGVERATMMRCVGIHRRAADRSRHALASIERAQTKVENHNFEIRKHILEYDDVMNKQRENIYGERRKNSKAETDCAFIVANARTEKIDATNDEPPPANSIRASGTLRRILDEIQPIFPVKAITALEEIEKIDRDAMKKLLER